MSIADIVTPIMGEIVLREAGFKRRTIDAYGDKIEWMHPITKVKISYDDFLDSDGPEAGLIMETINKSNDLLGIINLSASAAPIINTSISGDPFYRAPELPEIKPLPVSDTATSISEAKKELEKIVLGVDTSIGIDKAHVALKTVDVTYNEKHFEEVINEVNAGLADLVKRGFHKEYLILLGHYDFCQLSLGISKLSSDRFQPLNTYRGSKVHVLPIENFIEVVPFDNQEAVMYGIQMSEEIDSE